MEYYFTDIIPSEIEGALDPVTESWIYAGNGNNKMLRMAAALDSGQTVGYAVYSVTRAYEKDAELLYVYVKEEYRGQGIATELIKRTIAQLKSEGTLLMVALASAYEEYSRLFINCGMKSVLKSHMMVFSPEGVRESLMAKRLPELEALMKNVKSYDYLAKNSSLELERFRRRMEKKRKGRIKLEYLDHKYTAYYVVNDEIAAYFAFLVTADNYLYMVDMYIEDIPQTKYAIPAMLAAILKRSIESGGADMFMILFIMSEAQRDALITAFGQPCEEEFFTYFREEEILIS